jgi:hypothetical protein
MYQPQLIEVDPHRVKFNPKNPRKHEGEEFDRLKQSVGEIGVVQLPTVRVLPGGFYEVIDGEGRVRAAQVAQLDTIWVVSYGIVGDLDALTMLQSSNTVREFSFVAECRGAANLHRQGKPAESIAKALGLTPNVTRHFIGIGYFPNDVLDMIQRDALESVNDASTGTFTDSVNVPKKRIVWGHRTVREFLPLRQLLPGAKPPNEERPHDQCYDYTEVRIAVEKAIRREISTQEEINAYVEKRRRELFEQHFDKELRERLEAELIESKRALEESYSQQLQGAKEETAKRYEAQVAALQRQYDELDQEYKKVVAKAAKQPELIKQYEDRLQKKQNEAEQERARWQKLQQEVQQEVQKTQQEAQRSIQQQLSEAIKAQRKAMDEQLEQTKVDMEAYYAQKDQQRQLIAEKSVRQAVAHGTELLSQTQQSLLHITSPGFVKGVAWLSEAEVASLLAQIMAVQDTLAKALEAIRHGYTIEAEERTIANV